MSLTRMLATVLAKMKAIESYTEKYGVEAPFDLRHNYDYAAAMRENVVPKKWETLPWRDKMVDIAQMFLRTRKPFSPDTHMWPDKYKPHTQGSTSKEKIENALQYKFSDR